VIVRYRLEPPIEHRPPKGHRGRRSDVGSPPREWAGAPTRWTHVARERRHRGGQPTAPSPRGGLGRECHVGRVRQAASAIEHDDVDAGRGLAGIPEGPHRRAHFASSCESTVTVEAPASSLIDLDPRSRRVQVSATGRQRGAGLEHRIWIDGPVRHSERIVAGSIARENLQMRRLKIRETLRARGRVGRRRGAEQWTGQGTGRRAWTAGGARRASSPTAHEKRSKCHPFRDATNTGPTNGKSRARGNHFLAPRRNVKPRLR